MNYACCAHDLVWPAGHERATHTHTVGSKCQAVQKGIKVNEDQW